MGELEERVFQKVIVCDCWHVCILSVVQPGSLQLLSGSFCLFDFLSDWFFLFVFFWQLNFSLFDCLFSVFPQNNRKPVESGQQLVPVYQTSTNYRDVIMTRP